MRIVLFFIDVATRRVRISGASASLRARARDDEALRAVWDEVGRME